MTFSTEIRLSSSVSLLLRKPFQNENCSEGKLTKKWIAVLVFWMWLVMLKGEEENGVLAFLKISAIFSAIIILELISDL